MLIINTQHLQQVSGKKSWQGRGKAAAAKGVAMPLRSQCCIRWQQHHGSAVVVFDASDNLQAGEQSTNLLHPWKAFGQFTDGVTSVVVMLPVVVPRLVSMVSRRWISPEAVFGGWLWSVHSGRALLGAGALSSGSAKPGVKVWSNVSRLECFNRFWRWRFSGAVSSSCCSKREITFCFLESRHRYSTFILLYSGWINASFWFGCRWYFPIILYMRFRYGGCGVAGASWHPSTVLTWLDGLASELAWHSRPYHWLEMAPWQTKNDDLMYSAVADLLVMRSAVFDDNSIMTECSFCFWMKSTINRQDN